MEDKKKEEEERERRQREEVLNHKLDEEERKLKEMRRIQEELSNLNRSLNECISIASASIVNVGLRKKYTRMVEENHNSYIRSSQTVDYAMDETRNNIKKLSEEKIIEEEERKKEEQKQEELNEKETVQQ